MKMSMKSYAVRIVMILMLLLVATIIIAKNIDGSTEEAGEEEGAVMRTWNNIKHTLLVNLFHSYIFAPFITRPLVKAYDKMASRGGEISSSSVVETRQGEGQAKAQAGENKVVQAVEKSVGKAKQTLEDSAKSAADTVKSTISGHKTASSSAYQPGQEL